MDEPSGLTCNENDKLSSNENLSDCETLSTNTSLTCNEHDYSSRFEVPLEAIKKEIIEEEDCISGESQVPSNQNVTRVPILLPTPKIGNYSQRPNYPRQPKQPKLLPKLPEPKRFMFPPRQSVLLPRPILPSMQLPPPPLPPNIGAGQPPNCKGVLIVQDVKFCTMYVPKGDNSGTMNSPTPNMIPIPVDARPKAAVVQPNVITSTSSPVQPVQQPSLKIQNVQSVSVLKPKPGRPKTVGPTYRAIVTPKNLESSVANPLLWDVQKILNDLLPMFWFSAVEKNGINVMLLSYGIEKAIQRRLYVSCDGAVQISVHCKPIPEDFVNRIVEKAGSKTSLTDTTVRQFCEWIVKILQIFRDFQICVGLEKPEFREAFHNCEEIELDKNPYQETRYSETMRSVNCVKLVEITKRRCIECGKSLQNNKRQNVKPSTSSNQQNQGNDGTSEAHPAHPDSDPDWVETSPPKKNRRLKESDSKSKKKKKKKSGEQK
ncbi:Transcription termination factor Rho [Frankliniella fusca]|uniref:Transcription termination factor Rho n=1 Tax=Frankliniella fusca TaxID=407009 RepID=A0AAE1LRL6_9NEOP|nr:Transcription termination factor Rho [Frankliniella fusca]